jgi:hypothetical protein
MVTDLDLEEIVKRALLNRLAVAATPTGVKVRLPITDPQHSFLVVYVDRLSSGEYQVSDGGMLTSLIELRGTPILTSKSRVSEIERICAHFAVTWDKREETVRATSPPADLPNTIWRMTQVVNQIAMMESSNPPPSGAPFDSSVRAVFQAQGITFEPNATIYSTVTHKKYRFDMRLGDELVLALSFKRRTQRSVINNCLTKFVQLRALKSFDPSAKQYRSAIIVDDQRMVDEEIEWEPIALEVVPNVDYVFRWEDDFDQLITHFQTVTQHVQASN